MTIDRDGLSKEKGIAVNNTVSKRQKKIKRKKHIIHMYKGPLTIKSSVSYMSSESSLVYDAVISKSRRQLNIPISGSKEQRKPIGKYKERLLQQTPVTDGDNN